MSVAEKLRETLILLVPVVPLGQNEENIVINETYDIGPAGTSEKNRLVPLVPKLVPTDLPTPLNNVGPTGTSKNLSSGPESTILEKRIVEPPSEDLAHWDQRDQTKMEFPKTNDKSLGAGQLQVDEDPVSLGVRIGIKYANDTPEDLGEPVIRHPVDGTPLAYVNHEAHVKVFAWALLNLRFALWEPINIGKLAMECRISVKEARFGLDQLVQEGDLKVERNRGREYYWLAPPRYGRGTE
jgi:hypothetical protein